ncbi:MAG: transporter [Nitrospirae bacterium]|nr:transporter [Nitrospirota bacterium]
MFKKTVVMVVVLLWAGMALAAHPLITDDAGTQGKGKFQLEINGEYFNDSGSAVTEIAAALSAGITEDVDLVVGMPYQLLRIKGEDGHRTTDRGISDASVEMKWRFFESKGLSLALKPGVTFPTGNDKKGMGDGKISYGLFFIATKEMEPVTLHINFGYVRNRAEFRDIWHSSLACEHALTKDLRIVGNIGGETNPEKESNVHPMFLLGGIIYSFTENMDMDFGIKTGLNKAEADYTLLAGLAYRF